MLCGMLGIIWGMYFAVLLGIRTLRTAGGTANVCARRLVAAQQSRMHADAQARRQRIPTKGVKVVGMPHASRPLPCSYAAMLRRHQPT